MPLTLNDSFGPACHSVASTRSSYRKFPPKIGHGRMEGPGAAGSITHPNVKAPSTSTRNQDCTLIQGAQRCCLVRIKHVDCPPCLPYDIRDHKTQPQQRLRFPFRKNVTKSQDCPSSEKYFTPVKVGSMSPKKIHAWSLQTQPVVAKYYHYFDTSTVSLLRHRYRFFL